MSSANHFFIRALELRALPMPRLVSRWPDRGANRRGPNAIERPGGRADPGRWGASQPLAIPCLTVSRTNAARRRDGLDLPLGLLYACV